MLTPETNLKLIKGIGDSRAKAFSKLGIDNAGELLAFFPRGYEERGKVVPVAETGDGEMSSVIVTVCETARPHRTKSGLTVLRSTVRDDSMSMELVFFNSPFMEKTLLPGKQFRAYGRIRLGLFGREMVSPRLELIYPGRVLPYYVPIYRLSPPLTGKVVADAVSEVLPLCDGMENVIPDDAMTDNGLMQRKDAVRELHRPTDEKKLISARRTLAFEELLTFQTALGGMKSVRSGESAHPLTLSGSGIRKFILSLPYELTNAQKRVVKEIFSDMEKSVPMARLVQGDVGSGKTVVAACAIYLCVKNGFQACMMAPTEILAFQHRETLTRLLSPFGIKVGLLVSSLPAKEKKEVRDGLADGSIDLAVGTHALITDATAFRSLALAVTDEQHRFGVEQRAKLLDKSSDGSVRAHTLVMSATPIPRSLSLIIYGDLDVSLLDELPPGRLPVETRTVRDDGLESVYDYIKKEVSSGGQAYIVCPLIEDSETLDRKAAESHWKYLAGEVFRGIPTGLIHGKMKQSDKESAMESFVSGRTKILVSTTVIEVGVDVKDASVMVIENAECFGLSQLHQLRGRIGRGKRKSVCFLVNGSGGREAEERLHIMATTPDGFGIAEKDLAMRGPGDFFGERQSGDFAFACAEISDMAMIEKTKELAKRILRDRDNPSYAPVMKGAAKILERTGGGRTVN